MAEVETSGMTTNRPLSVVTLSGVLRHYWQNEKRERAAYLYVLCSEQNPQVLELGMCQSYAYVPKGDKIFNVTVPMLMNVMSYPPERCVNVIFDRVEKLIELWDAQFEGEE